MTLDECKTKILNVIAYGERSYRDITEEVGYGVDSNVFHYAIDALLKEGTVCECSFDLSGDNVKSIDKKGLKIKVRGTAAKKRKGARKSAALRKSETIHARLTTYELTLIKGFAKERGLSISDYIVRASLAYGNVEDVRSK